MSRYIDAEKLTDSIFDWDMTIEDLYYSLCKLVDDVPTADVQEVKHGSWVYKERTKVVNTDDVGILEGYRTITEENIDKATIILKKRITVKVPFCSLCGEHGDNEGDATPYCPCCGARMDGDNNG